MKTMPKITLLVFVSMTLMLSSCLAEPTQPVQVEPTLERLAETPTSEVTPTPNVEDGQGEDYALLVKLEDVFPTTILKLDMNTGNSSHVNLPAGTVLDSLSQSLAADQKTAVTRQPLSSSTRDMILVDLPSGEIKQILKLYLEQEPDFPAIYEGLPEETRAAMSRQGLGSTSLSLSYYDSLGKYWWSGHEARLFYVAANADGFTHLFSYDVQSQAIQQLENAPLYVRDALPSPEGQQVLLSKSADISLGNTSISDYYLLADDGSLTSLELPGMGEDITWAFQWQDESSFLAEAKTGEGLGSIGLYRYIVPTGQWETLSAAPFRAFYQVANRYFFLDGSQTAGTTLTVIGPEGRQQAWVDDDCFGFKASMIEGSVILLRCASGERAVQLPPTISDPMSEGPRIIFSHDRSSVLTLPPQDDFAESDLIRLYDEQRQLVLELVTDPVRQAFWQPDAQAFYYLTRLGLYRVRLGTDSPVLFLELTSDDYRQLDYAWVEW